MIHRVKTLAVESLRFQKKKKEIYDNTKREEMYDCFSSQGHTWGQVDFCRSASERRWPTTCSNCDGLHLRGELHMSIASCTAALRSQMQAHTSRETKSTERLRADVSHR